MKTLFLSSNTDVEASVRYRVYPFLDEYRRQGHEALISHFFEPRSKGLVRILRGFARRAADVLRSRSVDRIFVHREAFPLAINDYIRLLPRDKELIFDFDDSVFLEELDGYNKPGWRDWIRRPRSTRLLVQRAALTFAGNDFLAEYASRFSANVIVMPTVVDTGQFIPARRQKSGLPIVGWVGSPSTAHYLEPIMAALDEVGQVTPFELHIIGAERDFHLKHARVQNLAWQRHREVEHFQSLDVGLYPLTDDLWAHGKCGFKAIQYMACGVPCVVSPVGVVRSIVRDAVDGLWASSPGEWKDQLIALLRDPVSSIAMGHQGRQRAVEHYSIEAVLSTWMRGLLSPTSFSR